MKPGSRNQPSPTTTERSTAELEPPVQGLPSTDRLSSVLSTGSCVRVGVKRVVLSGKKASLHVRTWTRTRVRGLQDPRWSHSTTRTLCRVDQVGNGLFASKQLYDFRGITSPSKPVCLTMKQMTSFLRFNAEGKSNPYFRVEGPAC